MFEDTLLIIKPDFMYRRKQLLLKLLDEGFQILGQRKVAFSPEQAAQFYEHMTEDSCYMHYVILLTKGTSEALILSKHNAVQDLINILVCYFRTSVEMDRNVHVCRSSNAVQREISFIFPNYIHEPIPCLEKFEFCSQPILMPVFGQIFDMMKTGLDPSEDWKKKLSEWIIESHKMIPDISNQCNHSPKIGFQDKAAQTDVVVIKEPGGLGLEAAPSIGSSFTISSAGSSGQLSSSSCISCSCFDDGTTCFVMPQQIDEFDEILKKRLQKPETSKLIQIGQEDDENEKEKPQVFDEHVEWVNVYEYEDGLMDTESSDHELEGKLEVQSTVEIAPTEALLEAEPAILLEEDKIDLIETHTEEPPHEEEAVQPTVEEEPIKIEDAVVEQKSVVIVAPVEEVPAAAPEETQEQVPEAPTPVEETSGLKESAEAEPVEAPEAAETAPPNEPLVEAEVTTEQAPPATEEVTTGGGDDAADTPKE